MKKKKMKKKKKKIMESEIVFRYVYEIRLGGNVYQNEK